MTREKALVYQRLRLMDAALREAARVSSEKAEASRLATEDRRRGDARIKAGEARLAKLIEGGAPFDREASAELMDRERAAGLR